MVSRQPSERQLCPAHTLYRPRLRRRSAPARDTIVVPPSSKKVHPPQHGQYFDYSRRIWPRRGSDRSAEVGCQLGVASHRHSETSQSISMEPGDRLSWRCLVLRIYGDPEGSYRVGLFPGWYMGAFHTRAGVLRNFQMVLQALDRANVEAVLRGADGMKSLAFFLWSNETCTSSEGQMIGQPCLSAFLRGPRHRP